MKIMIRKMAFAVVILTASACHKLDLNVNPVQPVTVPPKQRLAAIEANLAYSLYSQARFAAYHSYYFTGRAANSNAITDTWNYNNITRMGAWRWHYFDVGSNINQMVKRAETESSNNYVGVGKIMLALSFLSATDVFGDMPFKEAYSGSFNPLYDSQEEVLAGVDNLLTEGITALDNVSALAETMDAKVDLIYSGNLNKWKALARGVRARLKLRTANFTNGNAALLAVVNDALVDFDDALFKYLDPNSTGWTHNLWGPADPPAGQFQFVDIRNNLEQSLPTDVLMKALTVAEATTGQPATPAIYDPRLYKLTTPGDNNQYNGAKMSEGTTGFTGGTDAWKNFARLQNGYWTSNNSPYPIMIKEELLFIKAETQFHMGDVDGALATYRQGIRVNMERLGIPEGQIINYLGSQKVAQSSADLKISHIMMQKYIALYIQAETWSDIRRYGYSAQQSDKAYPDLYYPRYALGEWNFRYIQRFPYDPQTEYQYNPKEIARLGARARDWAFKPVWWAEKSTLKN